MIDPIIDDQESIVSFIEWLNADGSILGIVPVDVQLELRRNLLRVDSRLYRGVTLIKHSKHTLIYIVVNQDNLRLCALDKPDHKPIGIEDLAIKEDVLFRGDRSLFQLFENLFNLMVGLQLLEFNSVKSLENLSIREQEMTHCDKCVHDAYTNVYRSIAMEHG